MYSPVKVKAGWFVADSGYQCAFFGYSGSRSAEAAAKDYADWKNRTDETHCQADEEIRFAGIPPFTTAGYEV